MTNPVLHGTSHIISLHLRGLCLAHSPSCCGLPWPKGQRVQTLRIFLALTLVTMGAERAQPHTVTVFLERRRKSSLESVYPAGPTRALLTATGNHHGKRCLPRVNADLRLPRQRWTSW